MNKDTILIFIGLLGIVSVYTVLIWAYLKTRIAALEYHNKRELAKFKAHNKRVSLMAEGENAVDQRLNDMFKDN